MSDIRTIVAKLRALGVDAEDILSVVEDIDAMLAGAQAAEARGPSKAAERTRRWRENKKASQNVTRDVTGDVSGDATPSPPDGPLSLPQTPTHTPLNPPTPSAPRRDRGCALPADWQPSAKHLALGYDRRFVEQQAEAMREWAGANRNRAVARKADWDLTFTGWLRREAGKSQTRAPPRRSFGDIAREGMEEIERRENGYRHRETDHNGPTLDFGASGEGADQFDLQPAGRHGWS